MKNNQSIFQNLYLDFVSATEKAAIASAKWTGRGDRVAADQAAVDAMRKTMNLIDFHGQIVIGEGAKDESAELYIGEKIGKGQGPMLDIAVDPLECTSSVAFGRQNAICVIALAPKGSLYKGADAYMKKIAVGPEAKNVVDLEAPTDVNIKKVAKALGKKVSEITVAVLDRERHVNLIKEIRATGARVQLISDGDLSMAISTCLRESPIDLLLGTGGGAESVLSATAVKCLGGAFYAQWNPGDDKQKARLAKAGITSYKKIFTSNDLAKGDDLLFTATGVLPGPLAGGVNFAGSHVHTETMVISSKPKLLRVIKTKHFL